MHSESLINILSALHPLSENFKESLDKELIPISRPKNYQLLEAPKIAEQCFFIERGFAMSYSFQEGRKRVEAFWMPGQIMTAAGSFFEQMPSNESIQLMEESNLLCLSHAGLYRLFEMHQETHFLYHKIMTRHYTKCRARIHDIQTLSALERFEILLKTYSGIEQMINQESIASYLNITPQSLSRLKRRRENFDKE